MDFSTIKNNVAHVTFDTSTDGLTRAGISINDAIFDIFTGKHKYKWLIDRITPKTITLTISENSYSIDSTIGKISNVWYQDNGRRYVINIIDNFRDFNRLIIDSSSQPLHISDCYIDYKSSTILFDGYPSSTFANSYTTHYMGQLEPSELSGDSDTPSLPDRLHRMVQELAIAYRKRDIGLIDEASFEAKRNLVLNRMKEEDNASLGSTVIPLETGVYKYRTNVDYR